MLNWDDLKVFLASYREGSIGRAAESLGVSGSTVSRRLTTLEEALGQNLFVRSPDGLKPTSAGTAAWEDAQQAERSVRRVQEGVGAHDALRGTVRVSVLSQLLGCVILPNWAPFAAAHPHIAVEFVEGVEVADLERWEADIGIRTVRPAASDNLVITRLRETRSGLFAARSLLRARGLDPHNPADLQAASDAQWSDWPCVDWTPEYDHLPLAQARAKLIPQARVVLRLSSMESIRLAACAGVGLALMPSFFGRVSPTLVELPQPHLDRRSSLFLVGHTATRSTVRVSAVWDSLVAMLRGDDDAQLMAQREALTAAYGVRFEEPTAPL